MLNEPSREMEHSRILHRAGSRALLCVTALQRFHAVTGSLPDSLEMLLPGYLDKLPSDPCKDSVLRYSREKEIVSSVGINLVDDGGLGLVQPYINMLPGKPERLQEENLVYPILPRQMRE